MMLLGLISSLGQTEKYSSLAVKLLETFQPLMDLFYKVRSGRTQGPESVEVSLKQNTTSNFTLHLINENKINVTQYTEVGSAKQTITFSVDLHESFTKDVGRFLIQLYELNFKK